jgi:hypothetical protein
MYRKVPRHSRPRDDCTPSPKSAILRVISSSKRMFPGFISLCIRPWLRMHCSPDSSWSVYMRTSGCVRCPRDWRISFKEPFVHKSNTICFNPLISKEPWHLRILRCRNFDCIEASSMSCSARSAVNQAVRGERDKLVAPPSLILMLSVPRIFHS